VRRDRGGQRRYAAKTEREHHTAESAVMISVIGRRCTSQRRQYAVRNWTAQVNHRKRWAWGGST